MATARKAKKHQQSLTFKTIGLLASGQAEATINHALQAALRDTEDRGLDKKPRKVTIEIELKALGGDAISATVRAKTSLPPYQTDPTVGEITLTERGVAEMQFSPAAPDNPDQPPLPIDSDE